MMLNIFEKLVGHTRHHCIHRVFVCRFQLHISYTVSSDTKGLLSLEVWQYKFLKEFKG